MMDDSEISKTQAGLIKLWVPMWKRDELVAAHKIICVGATLEDGQDGLSVADGNRPTLKLMLERIECFGYTARAAFKANLKSFYDKLNRKLKERDWTFGILNRVNEERGKLLWSASHSLIHANVSDDAVERGAFEETASIVGSRMGSASPQTPTLQWASRWVRSLVAEEVITQLYVSVDVVLAGGHASGVKGEMVEEMWLHRALIAVAFHEESRKSAFYLAESVCDDAPARVSTRGTRGKEAAKPRSQVTAELLKRTLCSSKKRTTRWIFDKASKLASPSLFVHSNRQ
eukprot:m.252064 g.252064  ORF g.252064 m.252064 type:complete len:288 (+) comp15906_c0_seq2:668-1531(+)